MDIPPLLWGGLLTALPGRRLVVADDEPDQLTYLATVFEDNGATVPRATTGDEALAIGSHREAGSADRQLPAVSPLHARLPLNDRRIVRVPIKESRRDAAHHRSDERAGATVVVGSPGVVDSFTWNRNPTQGVDTDDPTRIALTLTLLTASRLALPCSTDAADRNPNTDWLRDAACRRVHAPVARRRARIGASQPI